MVARSLEKATSRVPLLPVRAGTITPGHSSTMTAILKDMGTYT
jgi:hypothetical protein